MIKTNKATVFSGSLSLCRRPLGRTRIRELDVTHCTRTQRNPESRGLKRSLAVALPSSCLYTCSSERAKSIKRDKNLFTTRLWVWFGYKEQVMQVTIELIINLQHIFLLQVSPGSGPLSRRCWLCSPSQPSAAL